MATTSKNIHSIDDDIVSSFGSVFKGVKDQMYRVYIPQPDNIFVYNQHFVKDVGFIRCLQDRGDACPMCQRVGPPTQRFKTNMILLQTGTIDASINNLNYVVLSHFLLRFNGKMFSTLKAKNKKFAPHGLRAIDLSFKCTNDQYQHFDIDDVGQTQVAADERLKAMFQDCSKLFADFDKDPDARFPTEVEQKTWLTKSLGASVETTILPPSSTKQGQDLLNVTIPEVFAPNLPPASEEQEIPSFKEDETPDFASTAIADLIPAKEETVKQIPAADTKKLLEDV